MEDLLNTLVCQLTTKLNDHRSAPAPYKVGHLFSYIYKETEKDLTQEQKMDFLFLFNSYQKLLLNSRSGHRSLSDFWLSYIQKHPIQPTTPLGIYGMKQIECPALAYYYYAKKDYSIAEAYLYESFDYADKLAKIGFGKAMTAKIEQTLNLFRLQWNQQRQDESLTTAYILLNYILTDESNYWFENGWLTEIGNEAERVVFLHTFFQNVFTKILASQSANNYVSPFINQLVSQLAESIDYNEGAFNETKHVIHAISAHSKGNSELIFSLLQSDQALMNAVPDCLHYLFLECCLISFESAGLEITQLQKLLDAYYGMIKIPKRSISRELATTAA